VTRGVDPQLFASALYALQSLAQASLVKSRLKAARALGAFASHFPFLHHTHTYTRTHIYTHTHTPTLTHTHTHAHTNAHTYTHLFHTSTHLHIPLTHAHTLACFSVDAGVGLLPTLLTTVVSRVVAQSHTYSLISHTHTHAHLHVSL
jgi:hypothetical protein